MAKIILDDPLAAVQGRLSAHHKVIFRTRNGKTHAYVMTSQSSAPRSEQQQANSSAFAATSRQVHAEMADPARLAFWQKEFTAYTKHRNATIKTLYGYIFHTLYGQVKSAAGTPNA